ncbi:MAG: DUF948 domain-containing protein [Syntrophales bacterium]|jgi:uncharacterized protein YoxC|nr:DUF948 domain-containing protein [Syntrophales bacterium]NLN59493.1 DUF948 domain-containing protein [Deltaproteobacteria bacterium]
MLEISFIILSIAFLLLAGSLVAIFVQFWKILDHLRPTIDQLNLRLPSILRNLEDVAENIKDVSSQVHFQVLHLTRLVGQVQTWIGAVSVIEEKLKAGMFPQVLGRLRNTRALWKGARVFVRTLVSGDDKTAGS